VVANDLFHDPEFKVRIQDEASRHLRLKHPNIVPVLDVFETHGETCIVMKLIEGTSLDNLLESKADKRLEPHEAIPIVGDILKALDYAHRNAIVHRDVKPSNVLLDRDNRALLIDFGIALAVGEERRTRTGQTVGTPLYMSPEQITAPGEINHLSDVYSVGCVLYEMLTGRPPFVQGADGVGDTDFAIQQAHVKNRPKNPRNLVETIPAGLDELVMKALEKNPNQRIPGCQEFIRLLENPGAGPIVKPVLVPVISKLRIYYLPLILALLLVLLLVLLWP
jgi:serine/threonine-protein kinase